MLTTIAATISLLPAVVVGEPIDLKHTLQAGQTRIYTMKANASVGQEVVVNGDMQLKVSELKESGAKVELSMPVFSLTVDGSDAGGMMGSPESLTADMDKFGMPTELRIQNVDFIYVLFSTSNFLPAEAVDVGGEFKVDWKTSDSSVTVIGKGELLELTEKDGRKMAKIRKRLTVTPDGESPGDLDVSCEVWADTGELVSAKGTVTIDSGEVSFSFDAKPPTE